MTIADLPSTANCVSEITALPVTLTVSLEDAAIDIRPKPEALANLMKGSILQVVQDALPPLPNTSVKLDPFFFGPLDDRGLRWGLVFGAEARFGLDGQEIVNRARPRNDLGRRHKTAA